ncbi:hypothetical protein OG923_32925 (plasmid) [Streptomyces halstedii]|uniref:LPD29 domain-containing protein n=1 Tax=Streptomyces halstedii TaxID=1944 RepID=UPI002F90A509
MTATTTSPASRPFTADYLALRLPSGTWVRHVDDEAWRNWIAAPCACSPCASATLLGIPASHYELRTSDGVEAPITHVRYTSVVPRLQPDELFQTYATPLTLPLTAVHLRRLLRQSFPGVRFAVRRKRGWRLAVSWSGGPSRMEVATVTVTRFGRTTHGTPLVDTIALRRR